jgi:antitoxin VapB
MTQTAKLFRNGRSQAVRLPAEFRFDGKEVYVERVEGGVLLRAKPETVADWLDGFYASTEPFPDDFLLDREQTNAAQDREWFHHEDA